MKPSERIQQLVNEEHIRKGPMSAEDSIDIGLNAIVKFLDEFVGDSKYIGEPSNDRD